MAIQAVSKAKANSSRVVLAPADLFNPFFLDNRVEPRRLLPLFSSDEIGFSTLYLKSLPEKYIPSPGLLQILQVLDKPVPSQDFPAFLRSLGATVESVFIGPKRVLLDISYGCNLDCVYCRRHSPLNPGDPEKAKPEKQESYMTLNHIQGILKDAYDLMVEEFLLVGGGEPTINPEFKEIIRAVKAHGFGLNFSTNGLALKPDLVDVILEIGVDNMTVSVSGVTPKSYKATHPSKNKRIFDMLFRNFDYLNYRRRKMVQETQKEFVKPFCIFLHVLTTDNYHEVVDMALMGAEYGFDTIWFKLVHPSEWSRHLCLNSDQAEQVKAQIKAVKKLAPRLKIKIDDYMDQEIDHLSDDGTWSGYFHDKKRCFVGWNFAYIDLSKDYSFCCGDKIVGLHQSFTGFYDFWVSSQYKKARHCAKNINYGAKNIPTYNGGAIIDDFCKACDNTNFNEEMELDISRFGLKDLI